MVFTGITYDKGWTVKIDGKDTQTYAFEDGLLYFPVSPGTHQITLSYSAQGETLGIGISICSVCALSIYAVIALVRRRKAHAAGTV